VTLGAVAAALLLESPAVAAPKVTKAGPAPVVIPAGGKLAVKATARGSGRLQLVLSGSARSAKGGTLLAGKGAAVRARGRKVAVAGTVPKTLPAGQRRYVLVCGSAKATVKRGKGSCKSAGWAQTSAAGFSERLEAAVASRRLSAAKASLYALYAINRDPRLPVELRDAPGGSTAAGGLLRRAIANFKRYPKAVRKELLRYGLPPSAPGSPWRVKTVKGKKKRSSPAARAAASKCGADSRLRDSPYGDERPAKWLRYASSDGNAYVWYQQGDAAAKKTAREFASEMPKIWQALANQFQPPISDNATSCYHGPDGRYDVYINDALVDWADEPGSDAVGLTVPYPTAAGWPCEVTPSWVVLRSRQPRWALAHEFMHAIQFSYRRHGCPAEDDWWSEGGATWAGDFVYPDDDYEKREFGEWVTDPLGQSGIADDAYSAHPFFTFLAETTGVGTLNWIFDSAEDRPIVEAVDQAIPNGLHKQFPAFAIALWNNEPVGSSGFPLSESFAKWDEWATAPPRTDATDVKLDGMSGATFDLPIQNPGGVAPLSVAAYHRVTISDEKVREIRLENRLKSVPAGKVQAMAKLASGQWKLLEWSDQDPVLCRDNADENVQELIIVSTNAGPTATIPAFTHQLGARDTCRAPIEFTGTITVSRTSTNGDTMTSSRATLQLVLSTTSGKAGSNFLARPGSTWSASGEVKRDRACDYRRESTFSANGTFLVGEIAHARRFFDTPYAHGSGAVQLSYFHALRDRTHIPSARPWLGLDMTIVAPATEWHWDGDACVSETFDAINYLPDRQDWDVAFGQRDIYLKVVTDTQTGLALSADFDETITGHLGTTHHTKASGTLTVSKWEEQSG
jgi:hypothetical protein